MSKFVNAKLAKKLLIIGGLILGLGFVLGFFALFQAYAKLNCINTSDCNVDSQLQLVLVAKGMGLLGSVIALIGGAELIHLDRRK